LHRDLKPENVLLTDDLTVRVADFGVSLQFMDGANSAEDDLCGTPAYMPPEMLCGRSDASAVGDEQHVDGMASDVYAFGVIVCELLLSKSEFGILDTLVVNGGTNRKLGQVARSASDSDSMQRQWKFPPFPNDHNAPVCHYSDLGCRCCSFYPGERPSFTEVYVALNPSNDNAALASEMPQQAAGALKHSSRRLRSVSHASSEMGDSAVVASMTRPPPKLSAASIEVNVDAEIEQRTQIVVDKCGWRCWSRHGLRFANNDMEHRFLAFMHSDDFFRYLRWPYVVLAALQLVFMMAMFATNQPENAAHPFVSTALFSTAALNNWVPRLKQWSMLVLTFGALGAVVVQYCTVWADMEVSFDTVSLNASSNYSGQCDCSSFNNSSPNVTCICGSASDFFGNILLPLLQGLTTPVILMVLGLPFYLYQWLLALSAISWIGTIFAGFGALQVYWADFVGTAAIVILPGPVLFPICAVTAIASERVRRQMFQKLCSLRQQESNLVERATLRGYREALIANWRFLEASPGTNTRSETTHVVRAATISC